jgi:hypothetical protein
VKVGGGEVGRWRGKCGVVGDIAEPDLDAVVVECGMCSRAVVAGPRKG